MTNRTHQRRQRKALQAVLASDLYAHTVALSAAALSVADSSSHKPVLDHYIETLKTAICTTLFEAGMNDAQVANGFQTFAAKVGAISAQFSAEMRETAALVHAEPETMQ